MPLTNAKVRDAQPGEKQRKIFDEKGLHLVISPTGSKLWRLKYRFAGKEKTLSLGPWPEVSLTKARRDALSARTLLVDGIDPSAVKQERKAATRVATEGTLRAVAGDWIDRMGAGWSAKTRDRVRANLEADVFPYLGDEAVERVTAPEILRVLRRIESRGAVDMAHRTRQRLSQMFRYAIASGRADRDPAADLRGALPPAPRRKFAAILDPRELGALLRDLDAYHGSAVTKAALRLAPLLFVRPGELRNGRWADVDMKSKRWVIPASRMKAGRDHIVPLASQALAVLVELEQLTGDGVYLFPGQRSASRPLSENTINAALRRLGYEQEVMTGHGFRAIASTHLHEQGWTPDAIERQLAHVERSRVRAAYHRGEHLAERVKMMQAWADYLDGLRGGADVVPLARSGQ